MDLTQRFRDYVKFYNLYQFNVQERKKIKCVRNFHEINIFTQFYTNIGIAKDARAKFTCKTKFHKPYDVGLTIYVSRFYQCHLLNLEKGFKSGYRGKSSKWITFLVSSFLFLIIILYNYV